jgi:lysophospholipid acyltransferase
MSGVAYGGTIEGVEKFDRVTACVIYNLEFSYNVKDFLASWNMATQTWLKYHVYMRLLPNDRNKKTNNFLPTMATFMVSAIWHGFYFGFFVFFFSLGILDYMYKLGNQILVPLL